jgi:hypothetical protein
MRLYTLGEAAGLLGSMCCLNSSTFSKTLMRFLIQSEIDDSAIWRSSRCRRSACHNLLISTQVGPCPKSTHVIVITCSIDCSPGSQSAPIGTPARMKFLL